MDNIERIQGTDGVRGKTAEDRDMKGADPIQFFLETGLITPVFCEIYARVWADLLTSSGMAAEGDAVVVCQDPRDAEGRFVKAVLNGIRKAGLKAIMAGTLPTPAAPLLALFLKASGALVLTASHNPYDQNGIKLFHGFSGLKFLPEDDKLLTRKLLERRNMNPVDEPLKGNFEDQSARAGSLFSDFCRDPLNSWIEEQDFSDVILVVDASKGAAAETAREIFSCFSFKRVIYANLKGEINENCGVADLEGVRYIARDQVEPPGSPFYSYEALSAMFQIPRESESVRNGKVKLIGLALDGDADRCFRLDYHPEKDRVIVSSGDALGVCQAEFLSRRSGFKPGKSLFVNTVESDLNASDAAREFGFRTETTGVGDKWILLLATLDMIKTETDRNPLEGAAVNRYLKDNKELADISGLELSRLWKQYLESTAPAAPESSFSFKIGVEESGHCVTPGFFQAGGRLNRCLIGNGIKSGLNSLAAFESNYKNRISSQDRFEYLADPFSSGIKETFYIYHVDKSRILPGSEFRKKLLAFARDEFAKILPKGFSAEFAEFGEEKDMLYWRIIKEEDILGAVFVRNSGTENKAALYLRGRRSILDFALPLADTLHSRLLIGLKDMSALPAKAELKALSVIKAGGSPESLAEESGNLPFHRLLKEMELKEGLMERRGNKLRLTEKGSLFLERAKGFI